jgi:hypothetical protein
VLIAAVRYAFESEPTEFLMKDYGGRILAHINSKVLKPGLRNREALLSPQQLNEKAKNYESQARQLIAEIMLAKSQK